MKEEPKIPESGLTAIREHLECGQWKKNVKVLGVLVPEPKKLCYIYYCQILDKRGGIKQLEAAYYHCCNLVMNAQGKTDEEIQRYWWDKYYKDNPKQNKGYGK